MITFLHNLYLYFKIFKYNKILFSFELRDIKPQDRPRSSQIQKFQTSFYVLCVKKVKPWF